MSTVVKTVPSFSPIGEAIHSIESTAITCAVGEVIGSTPQARTMGGSPHATAAASDGWVSRCSCPRSLMGVFARICSHAELMGGRVNDYGGRTPRHNDARCKSTNDGARRRAGPWGASKDIG